LPRLWLDFSRELSLNFDGGEGRYDLVVNADHGFPLFLVGGGGDGLVEVLAGGKRDY